MNKLSGFVEVDVDADPVWFGDAEHDIEVGDRITVVGTKIKAADEIGAGPYGGVEQVGGPRVAKDAGLRDATTCTSARSVCACRAASTPSSRSRPQSVSTWAWLRTVVAPEAIVAPSVLVARSLTEPPALRQLARSLPIRPARPAPTVCGRNGKPSASSRDGRGHR